MWDPIPSDWAETDREREFIRMLNERGRRLGGQSVTQVSSATRIIVSGGGGGSSVTPRFPVTYSGTITPDLTNGAVQFVTLTGNIVVNFPTGASDGATLIFSWVQDATGGRTITLGTGWKYDGSQFRTGANTVSTIQVVFKSSTEVGAIVSVTTGVPA